MIFIFYWSDWCIELIIISSEIDEDSCNILSVKILHILENFFTQRIDYLCSLRTSMISHKL